MERYITYSPAAGIIQPSSSPVGAGFFFVSKKDQSLHPCTDFRGLNNITIKNKYPLPLINSAFEPHRVHQTGSQERLPPGPDQGGQRMENLGHFEYLVMPPRLTNAPAVFQALVND